MGSSRGYVPRGIHWNSREGKAIVSRIRLSRDTFAVALTFGFATSAFDWAQSYNDRDN